MPRFRLLMSLSLLGVAASLACGSKHPSTAQSSSCYTCLNVSTVNTMVGKRQS
jgi:hypothetical protein